MADISFADWVAGLAVDTLSGPEKIPLLDGTTSKHITASLLAAFAVDQLHQAAVVTALNDADELNAFQSDVEKIITAQNFFNWIVDKFEAVATETSIVSGDKLFYSDAGILKQIDIDNVKVFLDANADTLGEQINALSVATIADSDQYVVAQGTNGRKTTFADIAARVHSQFLAYLTARPAVGTLQDADAFFVDDGGVASKVTAVTVAAYVQAEVGNAILSSAWDTYSALGGPIASSDVFLLERSASGRTATGANLASYIVGSQDSASDAVSGASGDDFLVFRSGTQYKMDIGAVSTYVLASGWSAASGSPVATGDKVIIGRGGTTYSVTVDQLETFILNGIQNDVLNLTGLSSATLAGASIFLVGDGSTPRKATLTELETKLWADYQTYVSGLAALTALEDADVFYVIEGSTPKKITAANIAVYMDTEVWDRSDASPAVQSGDDVLMRRSGVTYKLDVGALATFVNSSLTSTMDFSALSAATISDTDLLILDEGATNGKVAVSDFRSHVHVKFVDYVSSTLTSALAVVDADLLYLVNGGSPYKVSVGDLWDLRFLADAKTIKLDDFAATDDNTDLNTSTSAHGLCPKLSNNSRQFLRGDGSWATFSSVTATPVAAAGSAYGDAAPLGTSNVAFITSASAATGVRLPTGAAGDIMFVINNSATAAKLYPAVGGSLNGLAINAAVVIPASKGLHCFCSAADTWTVFDMPARATTA